VQGDKISKTVELAQQKLVLYRLCVYVHSESVRRNKRNFCFCKTG